MLHVWTCPIGMMTPQHHHLGRIRTDMRLEGLRMVPPAQWWEWKHVLLGYLAANNWKEYIEQMDAPCYILML